MICTYCNQEMTDSVGCTLMHYTGEPSRIPHDGINACYDCDCPPGTMHHPGCCAERCAICGGQCISCGCDQSVENRHIGNIQPKISADLIADLLNRITKGPWHIGKYGGVYHISDYDDQTFGMEIPIAEVFEDADAEAIARVPELLAEILSLHKTIHTAAKLGYIVGLEDG